MPIYTPWTWSQAHGRHYAYILADDAHTVLDTLWSRPPVAAPPTGAAISDLEPNRAGRDALRSNLDDYDDQEDDNVDEDDSDDEEEQSDEDVMDSSCSTIYAGYLGQTSLSTREGEGVGQDPAIDTRAIKRYSLSSSSALEESSVPPNGRSSITHLPKDVQAQLGYRKRRFIQTGLSTNDEELLDSRYRRVRAPHRSHFFVPGRVFKMLWSQPAEQANPGGTRTSTHFSTVWIGEQAYSEIRHFIVVRNKGTFSQCIPIQTYRGRGAAKMGVIMSDHGIVHTSPEIPNQLQGEALTKYSIRVQPAKNETLHPASRVNYGRAYAVEHNVKVLDIGMVVEQHRYMLRVYFDEAMGGTSSYSRNEMRLPRPSVLSSSGTYTSLPTDQAAKTEAAANAPSEFTDIRESHVDREMDFDSIILATDVYRVRLKVPMFEEESCASSRRTWSTKTTGATIRGTDDS